MIVTLRSLMLSVLDHSSILVRLSIHAIMHIKCVILGFILNYITSVFSFASCYILCYFTNLFSCPVIFIKLTNFRCLFSLLFFISEIRHVMHCP